MHIIKLTELRRMEIMDTPMPRVAQATDVLIKIARVGVCGSDVHYFTDGRIGTQHVAFPWALGHEASGVVAEIGSDVTRVKVGDRIAIDPAMPCFVCDQCRAGRTHTCRNLNFLAVPGQVEGCLADYIVMPETSCYKIPDTMTMDEAAFVEPLTIGYYGAQLAEKLEGASIGILGAGPIGLSVLLAAKARGAGKIFITDKIDARLEAAKKAGAHWTGNPTKDHILAQVQEREPNLLDCIFECSGQQEAIDQGITLLKPGGQILLIGIPVPDRISFDINILRRREITVRNVRRQNNCVEKAIDLIASRQIDVTPLITHHFPFEQSQNAFDLVAAYGDGVVKAMIKCDTA